VNTVILLAHSSLTRDALAAISMKSKSAAHFPRKMPDWIRIVFWVKRVSRSLRGNQHPEPKERNMIQW
jgi:hypothetical protein